MAVICLDIGGTSIKGAIFYKNKLIKKKEIQTFINEKSRDEFLRNLDQLLAYFLKNYDKYKITSINIGIPGPYINKDKGILGKLKNLPLENFNIIEYIQNKYKIKVLFENDANCLALGEFYFGKNQCNSLVGVTLGTGFGVGIILNGESYSGNGNAGEISAEKYKNSILEDFVSKRGILRIAKEKGFNINNVKDLAKEEYRAVWDEFAIHLAFALSEIIMLINPEIIVISGKIAKAHKLFSKTLKSKIKDQIKFNIPKIKFVNKNLALYGALKI